jgi:hypothetical protein
MAWPVTLNGRVYNADDFEGTAYVTGMPNAFEDFINHSASIHSGLAKQAINLTDTTSQRGATISLSIVDPTAVVLGTTLSVNKSFAPGQPVRLAHYTGTTLDGYLDGTVTTFNPVTGTMSFLVGNRIKNSAADSYGGPTDPWNISIGGSGDVAPLTEGTDFYSKINANAEFLVEANNLSDLDSPSTAVANLGFTATISEINNVCDISGSGTNKNSHDHDTNYALTWSQATTPTALKAGDIWVNGSIIYISTTSGTTAWKQVFPAVYS